MNLRQHYRYWVLYRCPSVRFLDFQKVKDSERSKAKELFGTVNEPSALASKVRAPHFISFVLFPSKSPTNCIPN